MPRHAKKKTQKAIAVVEKQEVKDDGSIVFGMEVSEPIDVPICLCERFMGQNPNCSVHKTQMECPKCHCVDTEIPAYGDSVVTHFRCRLCGIMYIKNMVTGELV